MGWNSLWSNRGPQPWTALFKPHAPWYVSWLWFEPTVSRTFLYSTSAVVKWAHTALSTMWGFSRYVTAMHAQHSVSTHGRGLFSRTRQPSERKRKHTSGSREILNKSNTNIIMPFNLKLRSIVSLVTVVSYCRISSNFNHLPMAKLCFGFHEANFWQTPKSIIILLLLMCTITYQSAPLLPTVHSYIQTWHQCKVIESVLIFLMNL